MTTAKVAALGEQLKTDLVGAVEKAKEVSEEIRDRVGSSYHNIRRGVQKAQVAAEDAIEGARHEIKRHPLTTVGAVGFGAFALGLLTGWAIARKK